MPMSLFLAEYAHKTIENTQSYAGVIQGLERLKAAGFYLAICTNKPERYLPKILSHFGWLTLFDQVIGGDTLSVKKSPTQRLYYTCVNHWASHRLMPLWLVIQK